MYTVVRFSSASASKLEALGKALNVIEPATFDGLRGIAGRFSCFVCGSADWRDHEKAVTFFFTKFGSVMKKAAKLRSALNVDVALEPEDYAGRSLYNVPVSSKFIARLHKYRASLTISVYLIPADIKSVGRRKRR